MKTHIFSNHLISIVAISCVILFSCSDDDSESEARHNLMATIAAAETLLETTSEGLEEGDLAPGSKKQLSTRIRWAQYILKNSGTDEAFSNAAATLQSDMDTYQSNTIKPGFPSFQVGSSLDLGKVSDYDIYKQFTIEYNVRFKDLSGNNLFSSEDQIGGIITRYNQGAMQAYIHNGGWVGGDVNFAFQPQVWYHIAFVFDGQAIAFYVDGIPRLTVSGARKDLNVKPETHIKFGTHPIYEGRFFAGEVNHVSVWSYAKTSEQVIADAAKDYMGTEEGLLAYWPLNLNLGTSIVDKTGKYTATATLINWVAPN